MAAIISTTVPQAWKAQVPHLTLSCFVPSFVTPIMLGFDALLISLRSYIVAERELDAVDFWDPALRSWNQDAEDAQTRLTCKISEVRAHLEALPSDWPLKRMAMLLDLMLGTATRADLLKAHTLLTRYSVLFTCAESDPIAVRVNALLMRGRTLMSALVALPDYSEPTDSHANFDNQVSDFEDTDAFLTMA